MKLAFINPPGPRYLYRGTICTYISKARYVWKPKDFILLSSIVPPEWDVEFLDASINKINTESAIAWAKEQDADAFVLAMSSIAWPTDFEFLKALRAKFPQTKIVVFGEVFLEPSLIQEAKKYADHIIFDPLRSELPALLTQGTEAAWPHRSNGSRKETRELRTGIPRHALFDNTHYRWPFVKHFRFASVYTQFGCPFVCSYCTESITNVTYRPADIVLQEMALIKSLGYKELQIGDASFGHPRENAVKILEGMIREKFGFIWSSYTYPGLADEKMLDLMAASGCHTLVIGIDSADGALLQKYGRNLPQGRIRDFVANCHKRNIGVCGDLILGFKEDTKESCLKTIELAVELDLDYASFNIATPMMGSSIREEYQKTGMVEIGQTGFDTAGLNSVKGTENLTQRDLVWLRNHAVERFYMRPSYVWKHLRRARTLEELLIKANEGIGVFVNLIKQKRTLRDGYL